jgi:streptogramin lyase
VRRIAPDGQITTVAGDGTACTTPPVFNGNISSGCGDGKVATAAQLAGPYGVWVAPDGTLYIADGPRGLRLVSPSTGSIRTLPGTASYDVRDVVGDSTGALYATTRNPDYLIKIVMTGGGDATVTKAVGTGTSGYNGNTTRFGSLAPSTAVQISQPQGLSLGLDGNVIFAEAGNSMIRAYEPRTGHVTDVLGGLVSPGGVPQAGFNGDGHYGDQTKLDRPLDVAATAANTYMVADTGNNRIRELGPSPLDEDP